jgi:hypothetical protein
MELDALAPVCQETVAALKIRTFIAAQISVFHPPRNPPPVGILECRSVRGGLPHSRAAGRHNDFQRCVP